MVAQEWNGRKLNSSVYFEPDEQGLDLFRAYLESLRSEPVRLLLDLIEEEFRQVTIPLLRGADRQNIIERNFTKLFRNSGFRNAISQQVIRKGRKEERLLFTGLTNQELLKPWLEMLEATRTPLVGILSLPLISESLVNEFETNHDCVILVSQQVPSNLRQSVFIKGKLVLSRLVPIASFYQGDYAEDVIRDIEGTQRYLVSQRLIDRNDTISVQILTNKRHYDKLVIKCESGGTFDYQIHNINELIEKEKLEVSEEQDFSSVLFCYQATQKSFPNHYAGTAERKYFYHYIARLLARFTAIGLVTASLGFLAVSIAKGMLYDSTIHEMQLLEQKYVSKFNQLNEHKIDSDISTSDMKNVIQTVEKINKNYLRSPNQMMAMISQDISLFNDMRATSFDWFVADSIDATEPTPQASKVKDKKARRGRRGNVRRKGKQLFEIVRLDGKLLNFDGDYRYALSLVNDLEDTMIISGKYKQVEITRRPLNVAPSESLAGDVSVKLNKKKDDARAEFSLRVVREVKLNAK